MTGADRSGRRRARAAVPRAKRLDLRVSEDELVELRRLAGERGISIHRMLVDDALQRRAIEGNGSGHLSGVVIDEVVGELMRMRGELARAGNVANQAVREARKLDDETRKAMKLSTAVEAVKEIASVTQRVRSTATSIGRLR
jgi:predicted DNA binding CopG/RHH family protein